MYLYVNILIIYRKMPKYKQPLSLKELTLKSLKNFVLEFGCYLMEQLHEHEEGDIWQSLTNFLHPGLPYSLANQLTENLLGIVPILEKKAEGSMYSPHHSKDSIGMYLNVVERLVKVAIQPHLLELNLCDCSEFVCEVLCRNLYRLSNLESLEVKAIYSKGRKMAIRKIMKQNICFLKKLKTFKCENICTDEIIEVVAENCRQLENLNVKFSKHVTVQSTRAICMLQNLKCLNIWGTFIDKEACGVLLNQLKDLETFISDQDKIITNVTGALKMKKLMTICEPPDLVVSMCPQLTDITLHFVECNLSILTSLPNLKKFSVSNCNFDDIQTILESKSSQLFFLKLSEVRGVNLKIVNSCENLKSLQLLQCSYQPEISDFNNIHFKNLENLTIWEFYSPILQHIFSAYVSLKTVNLGKVPVLKDNIVYSLASKNKETLIEVTFKSCANLHIDTLKFLVDSCDNLHRLVYKNEDSEFDHLSDLYILKVYIEHKNLDVELVVDEPW